nr:hypothetical protein [Angustibacter aerolatus]
MSPVARLLGGRYEIGEPARPGRHGRGAPRPRRPARAHRRGEDAAVRPGSRPLVPGQVPARGPVGGCAEPPVGGRGLRQRRGSGRRRRGAHAVHRHGARRRPHPARACSTAAGRWAGGRRCRSRRACSRPWPTATAPASCTATSSPRTSWSTRPAT